MSDLCMSQKASVAFFFFSFVDVQFPAEALGSFVLFEAVLTAYLDYSSDLCFF